MSEVTATQEGLQVEDILSDSQQPLPLGTDPENKRDLDSLQIQSFELTGIEKLGEAIESVSRENSLTLASALSHKEAENIDVHKKRSKPDIMKILESAPPTGQVSKQNSYRGSVIPIDTGIQSQLEQTLEQTMQLKGQK